MCVCVSECGIAQLSTYCMSHSLHSVIWRQVCSCHLLQDPHREHEQPSCQDQSEGAGHWRRVVRPRECKKPGICSGLVCEGCSSEVLIMTSLLRCLMALSPSQSRGGGGRLSHPVIYLDNTVLLSLPTECFQQLQVSFLLLRNS